MAKKAEEKNAETSETTEEQKMENTCETETMLEEAQKESRTNPPAAEKTSKPDDLAAPEICRPEPPALQSLSALAAKYRVPAWQEAALLRFMGWNDDKMVTDGDYEKALAALKNRRIGGGRN